MTFARNATLAPALAVALFALGAATEARSGPIDTLQPGQWYEVPNSRMDQVLPSPIPPGYSGPKAVMEAWSGGAYDTRRDRLIVWGGGHGDYGGNEIYTFDMNTLQWSRVWGPSAGIPDPGATCVDTYSDGNPVSRHTYDGVEYLPSQDRFWINGGSRYCGSGSAGRDTWAFDFAGSRWERKADLPVCDGCAYLEAVSGYDPTTGHVFLAEAGQRLAEYDPAGDSWTWRGDNAVGSSKSGVFDWKRRKFLALGSGTVYMFDLSQSGTSTRQTLSTTGDTGILSGRYPGLVYDPVSDRIVAWNGGADVYTLNLDTLVWTRHGTTGSVVPTAAQSAGTYGRFQYVPSKNVFVAVNAIDGDVYIYRLSPGGGAPPDSIPPSPPGSVRAR
ncbi:MAG TPA: hypothetical protein VF363_02575 [Candidatus Eisenbacteria bacterium]